MLILGFSGIALASSYVLEPGATIQHPVVTSELIVVGTIVAEEIYQPPPLIWSHNGAKLVTGRPARMRQTVRIESVLEGDASLTHVVLSVLPSYFPGLDAGVTLLLHLVPVAESNPPVWTPDGIYFSVYQRLDAPCGAIAVNGDGALVSDYPADTHAIPTQFWAPSIAEDGTSGVPTKAELCMSLPWDTLVTNVRLAVASVGGSSP